MGAKVKTGPADRRADEQARAFRAAQPQRRLLAGGTLAYVALAAALFSASDDVRRIVILAIIAATALGLIFIRARRAGFALLILPLTVAIAHGGGITAIAWIDPRPDAVRFAFMYACLAPLLCLLAPTRRGALWATGAMCAVAAAGALAVGLRAESFDLVVALGLLAVTFVLSLCIADALDDARNETARLRDELARRATSDEITGVSNRAHVSLLAQNEFARARRYGEAYSCLMIEIEGYERLAAHGRDALNAVLQVFTGYCVVVMRHCDSFGRLGPSRFLALLPETPTLGAHTLANRMCRDLAALDVAHAGGKLNFTVSIGATEMHAVDRGAGDMLRRAEQGLADALERGGNCCVFATPPLSPPPAGEDARDITQAGGLNA